MSQTATPDGSADLRVDEALERNGASGSTEAIRHNHGPVRRPRTVSLVAGSILCVVALVFLSGGGWALWKDRVDRDGKGFVSFGTTELRTGQYAIVGDLRGDGPSWLYGSSVLGDVRVRATSRGEQPVFIGIARKDDVSRYLRGAGYATIYSFEVSAKSTHSGGAPSGPPSGESIWAKSTQGSGEQTLLWTPRSGDWSIVFMNANATANVDVRGDASAKLPILPWVALALLVAAGVSGFIGGWVLIRAIRRKNEKHPLRRDGAREPPPPAPVGTGI